MSRKMDGRKWNALSTADKIRHVLPQRRDWRTLDLAFVVGCQTGTANQTLRRIMLSKETFTRNRRLLRLRVGRDTVWWLA